MLGLPPGRVSRVEDGEGRRSTDPVFAMEESQSSPNGGRLDMFCRVNELTNFMPRAHVCGTRCCGRQLTDLYRHQKLFCRGKLRSIATGAGHARGERSTPLRYSAGASREATNSSI